MNKIELKSEFKECAVSELTEAEIKLVEQSKLASSKAYAPYSLFKVGASLLLINGEIILGNNQENAAFPSGLCAERVALFHYGSMNNSAAIQTIAICAQHLGVFTADYIIPCGACLQVLSEYQSRQELKIRVILYSSEGKVLLADGIQNFLPLQFRLKK